MTATYLPVTPQEISQLGWQQPDIILISGDAYVDHPAFAAAIIGRWLEYCGYRVAILPQPDFRNPLSFTCLGKPRLFFGITSGNMDSMINKYTARRKLRSEDAYTPEGKTDIRPDRATIVYSQTVHSLYKDVPIIIGGIEASMRRFPHYDYWSDKIRNSILLDCRAQYLVYGMGERAIRQIATNIENYGNITAENIKGTAVVTSSIPNNAVILPEYHKNFTKQEFRIMNKIYHDNYQLYPVYQKFAGRWLRINPPAEPLAAEILDILYGLPYTRLPHPIYHDKKISAFEQIKTSVTSHRGCFGGCNFCGIGYHQGKTIQSRSRTSILEEIKKISKQSYFHGTISDLGGPSANMYGLRCKQDISETCKRSSCLFPDICPNLDTDHNNLSILLKKAASISSVKHIFVASGIRFDLALKDHNYIKQIAASHTSGLLKLAPEHITPNILSLMHKPAFKLYQEFFKLFTGYSIKADKQQTIVPYIIIGHPGETLDDTIELAIFLKKEKMKLRQVQQYIPLPMTPSATMYYLEEDIKGNRLHVPKGRELRLMKALVQWYKPSSKKLILEALNLAKRRDLISFFLK